MGLYTDGSLIIITRNGSPVFNVNTTALSGGGGYYYEVWVYEPTDMYGGATVAQGTKATELDAQAAAFGEAARAAFLPPPTQTQIAWTLIDPSALVTARG
jgi:hypothetical protein